MVYFQGLFISQTHKTRSAYYLNHDILMAVTPQVRKKLIFYFIAEQLPEKLDEVDRSKYYSERFFNITLPVTAITLAGIVATLKLGTTAWRVFKKNIFYETTKTIALASLFGASANSIAWRTFEGPSLENSDILTNLSQKYNFTVYDFAVAKKESHVKKLLQVMDSNYSTLHSE